MTGTRWLTAILLGTFVLTGCAEQEPEELDTDMDFGADTVTTTTPTEDTASADLAVWNTDPDAELGPDEFGDWLEEQDFYGDMNTDGADGLTPEEVAAGLLDVFDGNDDGSVGETEWTEAGTTWFGDDASMSDWDTDGDGTLSEDELAAGIRDHDRWTEWDQDGDGTLNQTEFNDAVFSAWDDNDDGSIDETEWRPNFERWT